MRRLGLVKKLVELGAGLRKPPLGMGTSALEAGMRAIDGVTTMARHLRSGPLPPAGGLERLALMGAAAQLRVVARSLGLADTPPKEPPPKADPSAPSGESHPTDLGFVSPSQRSLMREEKEARMRAALGALVLETLALVDEVLATPAELKAPSTSPGHGLPPK